MFARQTEITQLLLCCIVIQSCLLHEAGSSLTRLKAESEPPSEDATTDDEDDYGTSWTRDTPASRIENNRPSEYRPRCQRERSNRSKDQKAITVEYILRRRKGRDYAQGEISRATDKRGRSLEEEVDHFLDDVDGLVSDSEDRDAPDTLPNEEVPVVINCEEVPVGSKDWECFRKTIGKTVLEIRGNRRNQSR